MPPRPPKVALRALAHNWGQSLPVPPSVRTILCYSSTLLGLSPSFWALPRCLPGSKYLILSTVYTQAGWLEWSQ